MLLLCVKMAEKAGSSGEKDQLKEVINHHLRALVFTRETERLRAASNVMSSMGKRTNKVSGGKRITSVGRDLTQH